MASGRPTFATPLWQRLAYGALAALVAVGCSDEPRGAPLALSPARRTFVQGPMASTPRAILTDPALTEAALITASMPSTAQASTRAAPSGQSEAGVFAEASRPVDEVEAKSFEPSQPLLLPPEAIDEGARRNGRVESYVSAPMVRPPIAAPVAEVAATPVAAADITPTPETGPMADTALVEVSPVASGEPTGAVVSERAQGKIRRGYALAQRGAYFAARRDLIEVLRTIAEAKDQLRGKARRTLALTKGLRALDEAVDFCPRGADGDAGLSVEVIVSSHRTPVGKQPDVARLMPQQLADMYLQYAQVQLGGAVVGEPAGSMALHALGKIYSQLGALEPDRQPLANRQAFALQHAALLARPDNHLAAHELGVMLAESGHYQEAEFMLSQVASRQPHSVVFKNLARVQRKLGREELAAASDRQAQTLASQGGHPGVRWVPPQALAQATDAVPPGPRMASGAPLPYSGGALPGGQLQPQYTR